MKGKLGWKRASSTPLEGVWFVSWCQVLFKDDIPGKCLIFGSMRLVFDGVPGYPFAFIGLLASMLFTTTVLLLHNMTSVYWYLSQ